MRFGSGIIFRDSAYSPGTSEGTRLLAPELTQIAQVSVQRNEKSQEVLADIATPQVREGPAIDVQKNVVTGLEARLATIIESDAEKKATYDTELAAYLEAYEAWRKGWKWFRGAEPKAPPAAFGSGLRSQVTEGDALEFNLRGILIDGLPEYERKNVEGFYRGLAEAARLVPLDSRVRGARSSGTPLPELVDGLAPLVIENTLRTMRWIQPVVATLNVEELRCPGEAVF